MVTKVVHLFERPDCFPIVAEKIHNEWWTDKPGHSPETMEARLRKANEPGTIPLSLLALVDDIPCGTVNLVDNDNDARPNLQPWLAALLVFPGYRSQGIGSKLVYRLIEDAKRMHLHEIFLGTNIPEYYYRFNAQEYDRLDSGLIIMKIDI